MTLAGLHRMPFALEFEESLTGSWRPVATTDARERSMRVALHGRTPKLGALLARRTIDVRGTIDAEELARERDLTGSIAIERDRLVYRLELDADDGRRVAFDGVRKRPRENPLETVSVLSATLSAGGEVFAKALLRFDLRSHFGALLRSVRVVF